MNEFLSTGQVAGLLGLKVRDVDYAISRGRAGRVTFFLGKRLLTHANIRELARHFNKAVPPGLQLAAGGGNPINIIQGDGR